MRPLRPERSALAKLSYAPCGFGEVTYSTAHANVVNADFRWTFGHLRRYVRARGKVRFIRRVEREFGHLLLSPDFRRPSHHENGASHTSTNPDLPGGKL